MITFPNFETHILIAEKNGKRSLIINRFPLFDSMGYVKGGYRSRNIEPAIEGRWEDGVKLIQGPWIKIRWTYILTLTTCKTRPLPVKHQKTEEINKRKATNVVIK